MAEKMEEQLRLLENQIHDSTVKYIDVLSKKGALQKKLEDGSIDLYSGYLDNVYKNILNGNDNVFGTKKYQLVCRGMKQHNTVVLGKTLASSSLGFAIDRKIAEYYKIKKNIRLKEECTIFKVCI